jgi:hypothetical protein
MNQLLDGLPESFEIFITSVGNLSDLTLSTLTGKLLHHESIHQNKQIESSSSSNLALYSRNQF